MSETVSVVQEDDVMVNPFERELRDAETLRYLDDLEEKENKKTLQEQAAQELDRNEVAQGNLSQGKENLKQLLGFGELNVVKEAIKTTFVEIDGEVFYQNEDGSLTLYQDGTGEGFKTESITVEEDFRGPEFGGVVKIYIGSHQDVLGRTIHEFIEETYRAPENMEVFLDDENSPEIIEQELNSGPKEENENSETLFDTKKIASEQEGVIVIENQEPQKTEFTLESFFSLPEKPSTSNNREIKNTENNFLNLEIFFPEKGKEVINVMSPETKHVASLVSEGIRQSTIRERQPNQNIITESPIEKPVAIQETSVPKNEPQSIDSNATEKISLSYEKPINIGKNKTETQTDYQPETTSSEKISLISTTEKPSFQPEISKPIEAINKPEAAITISFAEKPNPVEIALTQEHVLENQSPTETKTSPIETIKSTMRPVAETKVTSSPTKPAAKIMWGKQNIMDVMPSSVVEVLQQSVQELSQSPAGTEMVMSGPGNIEADTAFILRVDQPGTINVELYKTPTVEVAQTINPVTEITQISAEGTTVADQPIAGEVTPIVAEVAVETPSKNEENINLRTSENVQPETRDTISNPETITATSENTVVETSTNVPNNSERRRLTISSFFAEEENETNPSPTPRQQPAASRSRELAA